MEKKRLLGTLGAIALTAALTVAGTLAYLNSVTETKTNVFSSSKNVNTIITEEKDWENGWTDYIPGQVKAKTPVLTNKSTNQDVYVAMRLDFEGNDGTFMNQKDFEKYVTLGNFNEGDNWKLIKTYTKEDVNGNVGSALYLYKTALKTEEVTLPLFNEVTVNAGITGSVNQKFIEKTVMVKDSEGNLISVDKTSTQLSNETKFFDADGNLITDNVLSLPVFNIHAKGFAVQANDISIEDATAELIKLSDTNPTETGK